MRIAICEDNEIHALLLKKMICEWAKQRQKNVKINIFSSAEQMLVSIDDNIVFETAFVDISLKYMNGIELARRLRKENKCMLLVFVTADAAWAVQGYEVSAFRYLVKPIKKEQIEKVLDAADENLTIQNRDVIMISNAEQTDIVRKSDIIYIETKGHYLDIHTKSKILRIRKKLDELEAKLPYPQFCRCHRAFLCNMDYVESVMKNKIVLAENTIIPVSRSKQKYVNDCMIAYWLDT